LPAPSASSDPSVPELFAAGTLSTADMELNEAFTPDGRSIYISKRTPKFQLWVIMESRLEGDHWTEPQVASFSGQYSDNDPFVSPDGQKLFWSSTRPVDGKPKRDFDIWYVERAGTAWSSPQHLDAPVNGPGGEFYPSVASDGTLYFASNREGGKGGSDIYRSRLIDGRYTTPENLGESINTTVAEGDPYIAPDQSFLIFVSYNRPGGLGDGDLYISYRTSSGGWTPAVNLGAQVNSRALDFCPIVSPDGRTLYFTSERGFADTTLARPLTTRELNARLHGPGNGLGDLYRVSMSAVRR
jgi:Tol biopolymer transport system component